jgi:hypothetical protein
MEKMTLELATKLCLEGELAEGKEFMVVFSPEGVERFRKEGGEHEVNVLYEMRSGIIKPGDIVVHNHPNMMSLSDRDVGFAQQQGVEIHAVTQEGGDYWVTFKEADVEGADVVVKEYTLTSVLIDRALCGDVMKGNLTEKEANLLDQHLILLKMKKMFGLDYQYKLGAEMQAAVDKTRTFAPGVPA